MQKITTIRRETPELFQTYDWLGNIRELQNVIQRAIVSGENDAFHSIGSRNQEFHPTLPPLLPANQQLPKFRQLFL